MDEQSSKIISLPDMTVAFAALSTLFGNHTVLSKQSVSPEEYCHQFEIFVDSLERLRSEPKSTSYYSELCQFLPPVFTNFYLNLVLNKYPRIAAELLDKFGSVNYDGSLIALLASAKTEEHIRQSKEISRLLSCRVRLSLSSDSSEKLVKILEAHKLWLVYSAINDQTFVEQATVHEVDGVKGADSFYNERKEEALLSSSHTVTTDFESAAAAVRELQPGPSPVRLLTFSDGNDSTPSVGQLSRSGCCCAFARANSKVLILPAAQKMNMSSGDGRCGTELSTFNQPVTSMTFACDDNLLLAASGCDVIYWKIDPTNIESISANGKIASRLVAPSSLYSVQPVWVISVSPLDLFLANGCNDSTTNVFDLSNINSSSSLVRTLIDVSPDSVLAPVSSIAFHPNCAYLACGHSSGQIVMWDINDAAPVRRFSTSPLSPVAALQFSPDGTRLLAVDDTGLFSTWDLRSSATPVVSASTGVSRPASCMPVSADSSLACVAGLNKVVVLPVLSNSSSDTQQLTPFKLPRLSVLDADFRLGNILHVLAYKSLA